MREKEKKKTTLRQPGTMQGQGGVKGDMFAAGRSVGGVFSRQRVNFSVGQSTTVILPYYNTWYILSVDTGVAYAFSAAMITAVILIVINNWRTDII